MKITQRILSGTALAIALAAGFGVTSPLAALADQQPDEEVNACHLGQKVSEIQGWDVHKKYNVVVYRERARKSSHFNGIKFQGTLKARPCKEPFAKETKYHYVAFSGSGHFERKGDGGYRNWAFGGKYARKGKSNRVDFKPRR